MLNDQPGNIFRPSGGARTARRFSSRWKASRILIVDPVLVSRVELAQAISQPGFFVESASSAQQATRLLSEHQVSLVLVDHDLGDRGGLDFLTELRRTHPRVRRALVTDLQDLEAIRTRLDAADLRFVVRKPWDPTVLRGTVAASLEAAEDLSSWRRVSVPTIETRTRRARGGAAVHRVPESPDRRRLLVCGLLAGLNACENEESLYRLVHDEFASGLGVLASLWRSEASREVVLIRSGGSQGRSISRVDWNEITGLERRVLEAAATSARGARLEGRTGLDPRPSASDSRDSDSTVIGFAFSEAGARLLVVSLRLPADVAEEALSVLASIASGLGMALRRIRQAQQRAETARLLARQVRDDLTDPVGAFAHAVAGLRSEAEKAGLSGEWFDRLDTESDRVMRAVRALEVDMDGDPVRNPARTH